MNELQYGQQNLQTASGLTSLLASIAPKVNPMSPMSMYLTPAQAIGTAESNADRAQGGLNSQQAATAAQGAVNANMWGQIGGALSGIGGAVAAHYGPSGSAGAAANLGMTNGQYNNFINTPMGTTPQVQTDWSFPQNKNGL